MWLQRVLGGGAEQPEAPVATAAAVMCCRMGAGGGGGPILMHHSTPPPCDLGGWQRYKWHSHKPSSPNLTLPPPKEQRLRERWKS